MRYINLRFTYLLTSGLLVISSGGQSPEPRPPVYSPWVGP